MDRTQKSEQVDWIGKVFDENVVVVVANGGMSVPEFEALRGELREAGAGMKVVKNRLAKIAITGKPAEKLTDLFQGPTAIAFSVDPVAAPKAIKKYAKENEKLKILGGAMGEEIMDEKGVDALASMPSREELIASLVLTITSPASNLAAAIGAPASNLAGCIEAIEKKDAA
ncbi:MAG: 50S ribosomal protein L10 [Parvularculaceae bacterium]